MNIAVIGLGQIGGSLAARLTASHHIVTGFDLNDTLCAAALHRNIVSGIAGSGRETIAASDVIILATPIRQIIELLETYADALATKPLVTDTGSLKEAIFAAATSAGLTNFVGGHPLAGTEKHGPDSWNPQLFVAQPYFSCPIALANDHALAQFHDLVTSLGAREVVVDSGVHDRIFATSSNLPHLLAFLLKAQITEHRRDFAALDYFSCPSFRGATRVAASDPEMVFQMLWHNAPHLRRSLQRLRHSLDQAQKALDAGDEDAFRRLLTTHSEPIPE